MLEVEFDYLAHGQLAVSGGRNQRAKSLNEEIKAVCYKLLVRERPFTAKMLAQKSNCLANPRQRDTMLAADR